MMILMMIMYSIAQKTISSDIEIGKA